jgi:hypothetical protein
MKGKTTPIFSALGWALLLVAVMSSGAVAISAPAWTRLGNFGGGDLDYSNAVKIDAMGQVYVVGFFSTTARFHGTILTSIGGTDAYVLKMGATGKLRWIVQIGGAAGDDQTTDIAFDHAGNAYVSGFFNQSATFGSTDGNSKTVIGDAYETAFLAKYTSDGVLQWVQVGTVSGIRINRTHGVAVEPRSGTVYIIGVTQGAIRFTSSNGLTHSVAGSGAWHMFLVRYDTAGNFHWGETNEASPNSIPHKVAVDAANNAYVNGWFEGVSTFHSKDGNDVSVTGMSGPVGVYPDYPGDAFLTKYDSKGNLKWVNDIGGYKAIATDVAVAPDGTVSMTGFIGNIDGTSAQMETIVTSQPPGSNVSLGGGQFTDPYNRDLFIASYDSAGVLMSASRIGAADQDGGSGIAFDRQGNMYISGVFAGMVDVGGITLNGTKESNLLVLKYTAGSLAWATQADGAGTQGWEWNPLLAVTPNGGVVVSGTYQGTALFDSITLKGAGGYDIFAMELPVP